MKGTTIETIHILFMHLIHIWLTNVVSSNPGHGEVYSIQHYVTKFVSDLR